MVTRSAPAGASVGYPRKRRQTRRRLLQAGMSVLAEHGPGHLTAGQIAAAADVATGTFYNHFPTVEDFIGALVHDLVRGVEIGRDTLSAIEHDPTRRITIGVLQLLQMADTDPVSASAFLALTAVRPDFRSRVRALVDQAITDGVEAGCFDIVAGSAATNAVLGATLQAMRSRVLGESDGTEAVHIARLVLRLLGVEADSIEAIVSSAGATLAA